VRRRGRSVPGTGGEPAEAPPLSRLRAADLLPAGTLGLRTRRLRAALSGLGIAIGIAAIVGVLGVTQSSQSRLLAQIDQLGTNLLTVANGRDLGGQEAELPATATAMIRRVGGVLHTAPTAQLASGKVYRSELVPPGQTGGLAVRACDVSLLSTLDGELLQGRFLDDTLARYPVTVLGFQAAQVLGIHHLDSGTRVWLGGHWFAVVGIVKPLTLAPEVDRSALVGFPVSQRMLGYDGHPSRLYVRADDRRVVDVSNVLAATANPADPEQVDVSRPSDALTARVAVARSSASLLLGLGAIALLVGGIGIANVMVISVLERRSEIGLRRALGAARVHVAAQFITESLVLAVLGGLAGVAIGVAVTTVMSYARHWTVLVPGTAVWGGLGVAVVVGAVAGLYPALRAARLSPTDALRTV
jgi:putative ABC transport system permease protein